MSDKIKVLVVEPMKPCRVQEIPNTLEAMKQTIGGRIESFSYQREAIISNEEGKLLGLSANRRVGGDVIAGTFLIVGSADGEFCSLSGEDAAHYAQRFAQPISEPCPEGLRETTFYIM